MVFTPRIGVVGTGKRARSHLDSLYRVRNRNYLTTDNALDHPESAYAVHASDQPDHVTDTSGYEPEVTALCDPDPDERGQAVALCEGEGDDPAEFESLSGFRNGSDVDAVLVTSPNDTHVEAVPPLLEDGLDVFAEKPLATTIEDHETIIDAAGAASGLCYPAYNLRMSPFYRGLKEFVDEGAVGDLGMVTCHEVRSPLANGYRYSQERSGGALLEKNCHDFDLLSWYAGADPDRVLAAGGQHVLDEETDIIDQASVVIEFENGVVGTLELCLYAPWNQRGRNYELRGSDGLLRTPPESMAVDHYDAEGTDRHTVEAQGGHGGADDRQFLRFLQCLEGTADPPGSLADAKRAAAIALAGERAVRTGDPVQITDDYRIE